MKLSCMRFAIVIALLSLALQGEARSQPHTGQGILVGEVTPTSALIQIRLTTSNELVRRDLPGSPGVVQFTLRPVGGSEAVAKTFSAEARYDFIARAAFAGLRPNTRYLCTTRIGDKEGSLQPGPTAEFKTLAGADVATNVRFIVVTGMNYAKFHGDDRIDLAQHKIENNTALPPPYAGPDKHFGYPGLASILKLKPDFFVGTGDNVYYDTPDSFRARTIPELRQKWHEQFVQPRYRELFARVPTYWMVDDHDYRVDDCDNTGDYDPTSEVGRRMMLEQLPYGPHGDEKTKTYRTHRIGQDLQIWLPENRLYRSPNKTSDGPQKTIWGAEQKAWLKRTLLASDATFKLLISPTPMVGPDDLRKTDNHTNIGGFRHERDEFFAWLKETGLDKQHFYILCGDRHWQYHSVHPAGIEEFSCGALVDANSRLGRKPGDPKSTDPEGLIEQPYCQTPRSGGFLRVDVAAIPSEDNANLTFTWHDEHGKVLHQHAKSGRKTPASDEQLDSTHAYVARGMQRFRDNEIEKSIADFDQAAKLEPRIAPHLWQRGISLYYAGKFQAGREQFESHKAVNPHDVENAAWHFLCVARQENVEAGRKTLIEIDTRRDTRVPMAEVYELYAGRGSQETVLAAAKHDGSQRARMYAHLYLGLYYEVLGNEENARHFLDQAAAAKLQDHYMHDVARVHLGQRGW